MNEFNRIIQVRWADLDPNFHVRHSVYYDWGAFCRTEFFNEYGLSAASMIEHQIGPILFREECIFRREIKMNDKVKINLVMMQARKNFSRWSIQHTLIRDEDQVAAIITVDGAWIDVNKRKLTTPPTIVHDVYQQMPKAESFKWLD